jgi:hypothetical protein
MKQLKTFAISLTIVASIGSLYFMFKATPKQRSIILILLFTSWVLSPFLGLILSQKIISRRKNQNSSGIFWLMIVLSVLSLIVYSRVFIPPGIKTAMPYLLFPFLSWVMIAAYLFAFRRSLFK